MEINNDPRFFAGNVLDKRLDAFAGLGVVSGLFVGVAFDQVFGMKKDMHVFFGPTLMDWMQFVGLMIMSWVLWANILATYVSVAQIYHTYRLMTAGATGFDNAKLYYLNPDITFYRHLSIKSMLNSMWLFVFASGIRLWVKFSKECVSSPTWISTAQEEIAPDPGTQPRFQGFTILGLVVCSVYLFLAFTVWMVHRKHVMVFRERYRQLHISEEPLLAASMEMAKHRQSARLQGRPLDV